jgi:methyltransferase (TIGR00027 family)
MVISNISDTARWVAVYRAQETERPDAIFRDPYARRLAGSEGERIVSQLRGARGMAWAMVVRTAVFDELILRTVRNEGIDTVLMLATGFDTRPLRLQLPASLRWIEVDLPPLLAHKEEALRGERATCQMERVAVDLADPSARRELLARVAAQSRRAMVVTEGLIIYLSPDQVSDLARDLASHPTFQWWVTDLASPWLMQWMQKRVGKDLDRANAPFKFAPTEGTEFFSPRGWKEVEFRSTVSEGIRLRRGPAMLRLWRFLFGSGSEARRRRFERSGGIVLLRRDAT